jgi:hypothetical protein
MTGEDVIKGFLSGQLLKKGKSVKWKTAGETPTQEDGNEGKFISYSYLSFGKETSEVSYKLYNKSQEMRDVKTKNWILEHWNSNGYVEEMGDVWRLEFSIKNKNNPVANEDGEAVLRNFKSLEILDHEQLVKEWYDSVNTRFVFYVNSKKKRKDRNKELHLFNEFKPDYVKMPLCDNKETGRSQKIFAKKLMELNQDLRGDDFALGIFSKDLFNFYIEQYDLQSWAKKKGYQLEPTTLPDWAPYALKQLELKEAKQSNEFINQINLFNQQNLYNNLPF